VHSLGQSRKEVLHQKKERAEVVVVVVVVVVVDTAIPIDVQFPRALCSFKTLHTLDLFSELAGLLRPVIH
jgi:hypothetical protein